MNVGTKDYGERVFLPEDSYEFEVKGIGNVFEGRYEDKVTEKLPLTLEITHENKKHEIPFFVSTTITSGDGTRKSSKLFDVIEKASLLDDLKKTAEYWTGFGGNPEEVKKKQNSALVEWLKTNLMGKKGKCMLKTTKSKFDNKPYSVVDKIARFY